MSESLFEKVDRNLKHGNLQSAVATLSEIVKHSCEVMGEAFAVELPHVRVGDVSGQQVGRMSESEWSKFVFGIIQSFRDQVHDLRRDNGSLRRVIEKDNEEIGRVREDALRWHDERDALETERDELRADLGTAYGHLGRAIDIAEQLLVGTPTYRREPVRSALDALKANAADAVRQRRERGAR